MDCMPILTKARRLMLGKYSNYRELRSLYAASPVSGSKNNSSLRLFRNLEYRNNKLAVSSTNVARNNPSKSLQLIPNSHVRYLFPIVEHVFDTYSQFDKLDGNYSVDVHLVRKVTTPTSTTSNNSTDVNNNNSTMEEDTKGSESDLEDTETEDENEINKLHDIEADFSMAGLVLDVKNVKPAISRLYSNNEEYDGTDAVMECFLESGEYLIFDNKQYRNDENSIQNDIESNDGVNQGVFDYMTVNVTKL